MKIEINSSNIMTWADGDYGTFSQYALEYEREEGELAFSLQPLSISDSGVIANNRSNFNTDQMQMIALFIVHTSSVRARIQHHPLWQAIVSSHEQVLSTLIKKCIVRNAKCMQDNKPIPHTDSILTDALGKQAMSKHFSFQTHAREIDLSWDSRKHPQLSPDLLLKLPFAAIEQTNLEHQTLFDLFGRLAYLYAKNADDTIRWLQACTLAFHINNENVRSWLEGDDLDDLLRNS